jgi:tripartite-type tricarboxylate transporter receptor subunit TctC
MHKRHFMARCAGLVAGVLLAATGAATAQEIKGPVKLIVPFVPGGSTDTVARLIAPYIAKDLGVPVVVENRAGAASTVGLGVVAKATPDGTTLGMTDSAFVVNPSLMKSMPFDTQKDFAPVVMVASSPQVLMVNPQVPANTVQELVALAKAKPGSLSFATAGNGTAIHMAAEQLRLAADVDLVHVPYKGLGPAMADAMGGQVTMVFGGPHAARQHVAAGRLRALAITGSRRSPAMPDVMSFAEAGFPAVDMVTSNGIVAPAGTPPVIVARINAAVNQALSNSPELKQHFAGLGLEAVGGTPAQFRDWIATELPKWAKVVKAAKIQAD